MNSARVTSRPGSIAELIRNVRKSAVDLIKRSGWGDEEIATILSTQRVPDERRPRDKSRPGSLGGLEARHAASALRSVVRGELAWREGRFADAVKAAYQAGFDLGAIASSIVAREKGMAGARSTAFRKREKAIRFLKAAAAVECKMALKLGRQPSNKEIWCETVKVVKRKDGLTYQTFCRHWAQRRKDSQ